MKNVITIDQKAANEIFADCLDIIDLALLDVLITAAHAPAATKKVIGNTVYWHMPYKEMIRLLPTCKIKTADGMSRRVAKLKEAGAIKAHPDNQISGMCFWAFGDKMQSYYGYSQNHHHGQPAEKMPNPRTKAKSEPASWIKEYATEFDRILHEQGLERINWQVMGDREFSMLKKLRNEAIMPDLKKKIKTDPEPDQLFASFSALIKLAIAYFKQISHTDSAAITPTTVYRVYNTLKNYKPKQQPKQQPATHGNRLPGESDIQYMRRTMYNSNEER